MHASCISLSLYMHLSRNIQQHTSSYIMHGYADVIVIKVLYTYIFLCSGRKGRIKVKQYK